MPNAIETRIANLEHAITRRLDPSAEERRRAAQSLSAAAADFDALERTRSELRDRHAAVVARMRPPVTTLRKLLDELDTLERADGDPYTSQWRATHVEKVQRDLRPSLIGSGWLRDAIEQLERQLADLQVTR